MQTLVRSRSNKWFDSAFDPAPPPPSVSRKRERDSDLGIVSVSKKASVLDPDQLWICRHRPTSADQLAVQPKKVEEVRDWLCSHIATGGVLLLTGPPGCGKTATVQYLASELDLQIQEWINPVDSVDYGDETRTIIESRYIHEDNLSFSSHTNLLKEWIKRAKFSALGGENQVSKLILIEDFPNFVLRKPKDFQDILENYAETRHKPPLVLVCTDDSAAKDSIHRLVFKPDFVSRIGIVTVTFNAATTTNVVKMLTRIATDESKRGVVKFKLPDKQTLEILAESTGGDLRSAINCLQFSCLNSGNDIASLFQQSTSLSSTKARKTAAKKSGNIDTGAKKSETGAKKSAKSSVGSKDTSLVLFHALGKVLYAKREEQEEQEYLPPHLEKHRRRTLQAVPEDVFDKATISEEGFTCFLHHNFPSFYTSIEDVARLSAYLSTSDLLLREWGMAGKMDVREYGLSVASRGVMFSNQNPAKVSGLRKLTKPELYAVNKRVESNLASIQSALGGRFVSQPRCELFTSTVPLLANLKPKGIPAHLINSIVDIGRISGVTHPMGERGGGRRQHVAEEEMEDFFSDDDEEINELFNHAASTPGTELPVLLAEDDAEDIIEDFDD